MNALQAAVSFRWLKRPDVLKCPAPILIFNTSKLSSVFMALNRATRFAGS
jgi:hypothetical protein